MEKYIKEFKKLPQSYQVVAGILVVAIFITFVNLVFLVKYKKHIIKYNQAIEAYNAQLQNATSTEEVTAPTPVYRKPSAPVTAGEEDASNQYLADLEKYSNRRVQLSNCLATPSYMRWANGTSLMFDNRDDFPITLTVDGTARNIDALGYRILTFSNSNLPHTVKIDCSGAGQPKYNIANIDLF